MTTQQQAGQPAELGERVATLEGGFSELSIRVETLQRSVDNLRVEVQAGFAALREDINRFKNQVLFFILGAWVAGSATIGGAIIAANRLG